MKFYRFAVLTTLLFIALNIPSFSAKTKKNEDSAVVTQNQRVFIAQIEFGPKANEITEDKVEAAMYLSCKMTGKYTLVSQSERDSVISVMNEKKKKTTVMNVANELNADRIYFIKVNRLHNIIRVDITSSDKKNSKKSRSGTGYSFVNFVKKENEKPMYDPSLLKATQRAFASVERDSMMFDKAEGPFRVYPAASLVIGGIDIRENNKFEPWKLFDKKMTTAFDASEVIFETLKDSPVFLAYDMSSRDSIYALFNMHIVENYRPPTSHEMEALSKLQVEYYITGLMNRVEEGAKLELYLCRINDKSLNIVGEESGIVEKDDVETLRKLVRALTKKLLKVPDVKYSN